MNILTRTGALDQFRFIAALLVIANHISPLISFNDEVDFVFTRIIARIAVPFFLMVSGYFLYSYIDKGDTRYIINFCKKIGLLYAASILMFLPLNIYAGHFAGEYGWGQFIKDLFVNGTFYHLWYLPGLITGVLIVVLLVKIIGFRRTTSISVFLYIIGLFGDSYYGVTTQLPWLEGFYSQIFAVSDYTRNGVFMVPIFLVMGMLIYRRQHAKRSVATKVWLAVCTALLIAEGMLLHSLYLQRHDSMYVMLVPTMYFVFMYLLELRGKGSKEIRTVATMIYIIHPWMIVLVRFIARLLHLEEFLIDHSFLHYLAVSILSYGTAQLFVLLWQRVRTKPSATSRAWVEIDLDALRDNIKALKALIPQKTSIMAVVKANAYGHGAVRVAKALYKDGIRSFAVATLAEGIELRKNGVRGDILILGYTDPQQVRLLKKYHLMQTVIDLTHARALNEQGIKIKVHLKIDTGMHRLGVDASKLTELEEMFACTYLMIEGVFSHLAVSDRLEEANVTYTKKQIERFDKIIRWLRSKGYATGKRHIQASYGILNYPHLRYDFVRAGIALYGVLSNHDRVLSKVDLKPALSIKARVATVKPLLPGEYVGYGKTYAATDPKQIATVTIGYADGMPRNVSTGFVLIRGQRAPIVGRICMDQLMVDVTNIDGVQANDIVTIIGTDGSEQITCEDFAERCGTISNEILSRLGSRLVYV